MIDPLDGTTNFLHGFPVYAVSIAEKKILRSFKVAKGYAPDPVVPKP